MSCFGPSKMQIKLAFMTREMQAHRDGRLAAEAEVARLKEQYALRQGQLQTEILHLLNDSAQQRTERVDLETEVVCLKACIESLELGKQQDEVAMGSLQKQVQDLQRTAASAQQAADRHQKEHAATRSKLKRLTQAMEMLNMVTKEALPKGETDLRKSNAQMHHIIQQSMAEGGGMELSGQEADVSRLQISGQRDNSSRRG